VIDKHKINLDEKEAQFFDGDFSINRKLPQCSNNRLGIKMKTLLLAVMKKTW
jgi:hypothetical protein